MLLSKSLGHNVEKTCRKILVAEHRCAMPHRMPSRKRYRCQLVNNVPENNTAQGEHCKQLHTFCAISSMPDCACKKKHVENKSASQESCLNPKPRPKLYIQYVTDMQPNVYIHIQQFSKCELICVRSTLVFTKQTRCLDNNSN